MTAKQRPSSQVERSNRRVAVICGGVVLGMVGLSYAAVPLYDLFCRVTGYGGTTQTSDVGADEILDRTMTVQFDASLAAGMPWVFKPLQFSQEVNIGESGLAFYEAKNPTDRPVVGRATYNVTPQKAGSYFAKLECFCFTEQLLEPGESIEMPVSYFIDPAIADDPNLDEVKTVTLSYTFFEVENPDAEQTVSLNAQ